MRMRAALLGLGASVAFLGSAVPDVASADPAQNKALVESFYRDVFFARNADAASKYLRSDYIQHNVHVPTGLKGFQDFFRPIFAKPADPNAHEEILHLVCEGDLVMIHTLYSTVDKDGKPKREAGFDLFRVQDGMIAEHWDSDI